MSCILNSGFFYVNAYKICRKHRFKIFKLKVCSKIVNILVGRVMNLEILCFLLKKCLRYFIVSF